MIDVDLGDGVFRKLPCNNGASYYEVSDKFCAREGLGRAYTEQIVAFLRQNTLPYKTREEVPPPSDNQLMDNFLGALPKPTCSKIPSRAKVMYEQIKLDGLKRKILEFNEEL